MTAFRRGSHWWQARDRRERAMVSVMLAMLAGFVLWYALVAPLREARAAARSEYDRAEAELVVVEAAVRRIAWLQQQHPPAPADEDLPGLILDSAEAEGVAISRQRNGQDGALELEIDAVAAPALLGWLDSMRRQQRIAPSQVTIDKANGQLRVQLRFPPANNR
ncbi:MAG: type II secretion system protein M [Pseudomonadota bacterium]|nr:type II secretion system protein M [Pseudomonadota bacterium]